MLGSVFKKLVAINAEFNFVLIAQFLLDLLVLRMILSWLKLSETILFFLPFFLQMAVLIDFLILFLIPFFYLVLFMTCYSFILTACALFPL